VPAVVIRPSIVAGDSRTGEISELQGLHLVVTGIVTGAVPVVPGNAGGMVDFVPRDYLAAVVARLVDLPADQWPAELWVTQGPAAMPVGHVIDIANRFARVVGLTSKPARCMPYETIERLFLPAFLAELPPRRQREFRMLLRLARYMNIRRAFPGSPELHARLGLGPPPAPAPLLERNLEWWWRSRSGSRSGSVAERAS
jgi:thioester reductase-like protein